MALDNFVMVMNTDDMTVFPKESSWFGFYAPGQDVVLQTLQESQIYTEVGNMWCCICVSIK